MPTTTEPLSDFDAASGAEQLTIERVLPVQDDRLTTIVAVAKRLDELAEEIGRDTAALENKQAALKDLAERQLPDLLRSVGLTEMLLVGGRRISTKTDYFASIPKGSAATYAWLRERNMGGIIKEEISVVAGLRTRLTEAGIPFEAKETVHPSTLRAFAKEQAEAGNPLPPELFQVHAVERAVIK